MKIVISAQDGKMESQVDQRFGRCQWLIVFDTETNEWEACENPGVSQSGGAGVAAAQFVADQKADVVMSGDFGPNAARAFSASNIEMRRFTDEIKTVQDAINQFIKDK